MLIRVKITSDSGPTEVHEFLDYEALLEFSIKRADGGMDIEKMLDLSTEEKEALGESIFPTVNNRPILRKDGIISRILKYVKN